MKKILFIAVLFLLQSFNGNSQSLRLSIKRSVVPAFFGLAAGTCHATKEALLFRKEGFFKRFPNANRNWWDNSISWERKYNRPWYVPDALSDGYHTMEVGKLAGQSLAGASISIGAIFHKENKKQLLLGVLVGFAANSIAYAASSGIVFSKFYTIRR